MYVLSLILKHFLQLILYIVIPIVLLKFMSSLGFPKTQGFIVMEVGVLSLSWEIPVMVEN